MTQEFPGAAADAKEDRELLSRVARQNRAAFETLYRRYYRRVFHFVLRMARSEAAAEEIVSDVMLAVWRGAASFEGGSTVSTWVLGIAYRQALKTLDRNRKHAVVDSDEEALVATVDTDPGVDPEYNAITDSDGELLQKGIDSLSAQHREVVELTALGYSYGEISEVVGCPENTVKTRMFHARQQLKRFLGDRVHTGVNDPATPPAKPLWPSNTQIS
jgi:RNA polymerase sigma-70 factor, ECF subfamily